MHDAQTLIQRLQALPPERIAEVEDFVAFIAAREQDQALRRAATFASEPAFSAIWDNPDDAAYDAI